MKPWERAAKGAVQKKDPTPALSVSNQVKGITFLMEKTQAYWSELGKKKRIVAQFLVPNDPASCWYVEVDPKGGKCATGVHASPTVTWESDLEAMDSAFRGSILPGRVKVTGDFEEMRSLFKAIAATQIPGL
ncbi:MAG: hypothetical protein HY791_11565 [Deltaproteobacteria bacterium]|nr:hypothetical protein [Deltaproteobacteria bacterium]